MMGKIFLDKEFEKFWTKIEKGENFALIRFGDGERALMMGKEVAAREGWHSSGGEISKLGKALYETLSFESDSFYHGISCPCCDNEAYYWYSTRIANKNRTFANLWVNANYRKLMEKFPKFKKDAVLIANYRAAGHKIGNLNILRHYKISDEYLAFWENEADALIEGIKQDFGKEKDLLYVVSAGSMSNPIVYQLFKNNPDNCYIDFGSSLDGFYHEGVKQPYMMPGHKGAISNCWMDDPICTDFSVSVVLNLYKRPKNLEKQLSAIETQSLKPQEIILYQDGITEGAKVEIPENLKPRFDNIKISNSNTGVWGRFAFAQETAKSKYVSVFDDDTIPGNRWLENCHSEMLKKRGLYGTIGIVMEKPENYPISDYFRIGWNNPFNETLEVDFVGHSWFFEKDWLQYLFQSPKEIQDLKIVGEDMGFSCQLFRAVGIKTFVPPHPNDNFDLYGSFPHISSKLGNDEHATYMGQDNLKKMNCAIRILLKNGWNTLAQRNFDYIIKSKKLIRKYNNKNSLYNQLLKHILNVRWEIDDKLIEIFFIQVFRKKNKWVQDESGRFYMVNVTKFLGLKIKSAPLHNKWRKST